MTYQRNAGLFERRLAVLAGKKCRTHKRTKNVESIGALEESIDAYEKSSANKVATPRWDIPKLNIELKLMILQLQVLKNTEVRRAEMERAYSKCTTRSHYTYAFGALLTLIGKIFGIDFESTPG